MTSYSELSPFKWANQQYRAFALDARRRAILATGMHRDSFLKIARECEQRAFETEAHDAESGNWRIADSKPIMPAIKK
jgi:hypothetical protein